MTARPSDRIGLAILLSLLALLLFDLMGLIIKYLSDSYGAAELSAYRNVFGIIPSVVALWSTRSWHAGGRKLWIPQWRLAAMRGSFIVFAQFLFYFSLGKLPFATATTITYANALFMTALAVPILGERVGLLRWGAVIVGFVGVMMIVGPTPDSFDARALAPLGAAFLYALSGVTSRLFDPGVPSPVVNLYSVVVAMVGSVLLALSTGGFSPILSLSDLGWIIAMGAFGGSAVLCLIVSYRMTEQSNLAPFSYFGIPMAFVFGWVFFDEAPFDALFPGAILIAAGGLLVIWRDQRRKRT